MIDPIVHVCLLHGLRSSLKIGLKFCLRPWPVGGNNKDKRFMPTAGRLAGAVFLALYGWYIAGIAIPYFPEANAPGYLIPLCAALGVFFGWRMLGRHAGLGYQAAIGQGLTVGLVFGFSVLFVMGFMQMISKAMRHHYDGPMEALLGSFTEAGVIALYFASINIIASILIGGVLCAWGTEYFAKRYP
ncbi:TrgA family protein [Yoonia maritima]|nr:TrgA family protein [Yoonia maritima]